MKLECIFGIFWDELCHVSSVRGRGGEDGEFGRGGLEVAGGGSPGVVVHPGDSLTKYTSHMQRVG